MIKTYRDRIRIEAREMLVKVQSTLATRGIETGARTEIGSPARVIVGLGGDYDLTVVGAHDRYTRGKPGLGPVASHVVASSPNTILIGRGAPVDKVWRILAAVDGSLASKRALNLIGTYFNSQAVDITVMHVTETPWIQLGLGRDWLSSPKERIHHSEEQLEAAIENEMNYEAEDIVESARLLLENYGLSATRMILEGDPALEIISETEKGEYDLIVLGATGGSDLKHALLGGVSTRVARDASCSVLITKYAE